MRIAFVCFIFMLLPSMLISQQQDISLFKDGKKLKVSPLLYKKNGESNKENLRVLVNNHSNFKSWMQNSLPNIDINRTIYHNIFEISNVTPKVFLKLLDCEWIDFVDLSDRTPTEERTIINSDLSINKISPVHSFFPNLSGLGMVASIKEKPFDTTDIDLRGRIIASVPVEDIPTLHATFMATYIAGAANSGPKGKGAAWQSQITSSTFNNLMPDDGQKLTSLNVSVQNHSYGVSQIENYYGIETMEYDKQCLDFPNIIHVFSSGNMGTDTSKTGTYAGIPKYANLTGQFKMSKNTISIGATDLYGNVADLSSRGPAYDGRIKPELVAYGDGGTSDAAALTSGICLLVQQAFKENNNGNLPPSDLVKAAIINTADDVGRPGIDFETGFGSIDAYGAVKTILENCFINSSIVNGEEKVFNISVPANTNNFKVTLVWIDPEAAVNSSTALINDLNLEVFQTSTGTSWKPWVLNHYPNADSLVLPAKRLTDHLNNIEQVTLSLPEGGNYELHVKGEKINNGLQNFSIAYEYESGFEWIYPLKTSQLESDRKIQIRWQYSGNYETALLEYQIAGTNVWNLIGNDISLSQSYYDWIPPDTNALAIIRFKTTSQEFITDIFSISKPIYLKVGYSCDDEALINWLPLPEANEYKLYQLGEKYLGIYKITQDTFIILNNQDLLNHYYTISPIIKGNEGIRSNTINYTSTSVGCYFISFFPKYYVTDTVLLDLKIASNYRLKSATLERFTNNGYIKIQSIEPITSLQMTLEDLKPLPNRNLYRICLERDDQKLIYSDNVEVFFNPVNSLFVFPNPVANGQNLNVIDGQEIPVTMNLYDSSGKFLYGYETGPDAVKVFPIKEIAAGFYILEFINQDGYKMSKQIMVINPK